MKIPGGHKGITLVELLIVVSIIAVLIVVTGFQYSSWQGKYKVESQVKTVYGDVMGARIRAMQNNRSFQLQFTTFGYRVFWDTLGTGAGLWVPAPGWTTTVRLQRPYQFAGWGTLFIDSRGFLSWGATPQDWTTDNTIATLRIGGWATSNIPDYTCIVLKKTRILMGWTTPQNDLSGECLEK